MDIKTQQMDRLIELTKRHRIVMRDRRILISIYNNASGFLWSLAMRDGGTDLGWSDGHGNCEHSGAFISYEDALEDALDLVEKCDLVRYDSKSRELNDGMVHWGNYANFLRTHYSEDIKKSTEHTVEVESNNTTNPIDEVGVDNLKANDGSYTLKKYSSHTDLRAITVG